MALLRFAVWIAKVVEVAVLVLVGAGDINHDMSVWHGMESVDILPDSVDAGDGIKLCVESVLVSFVGLFKHFHNIGAVDSPDIHIIAKKLCNCKLHHILSVLDIVDPSNPVQVILVYGLCSL